MFTLLLLGCIAYLPAFIRRQEQYDHVLLLSQQIQSIPFPSEASSGVFAVDQEVG